MSRQLQLASPLDRRRAFPHALRSAKGAIYACSVAALVASLASAPARADVSPTAPVGVAPAVTSPVAQATDTPSPAMSPMAPGSAASPAAPNGSAASDQTAPRRNPESANGHPNVPEHFNGMFGDLGGARTKLAEHGFTFNGHIVSEFAGNATGGFQLPDGSDQKGTALSTEVGLGIDYDLGMASHSNLGIIHALVTTRFGSSLSNNVLGNLVSVQEIYGDGQTTRFTYLDYEQLLANKKVSIEVGKINQQNDFIAGPSYWGGNLYCFFQNNNICGTPAGIPVNNGVTPAGSAGYNYYPSSMWGGRLKISPSSSFYVEGAALQVNPIVNSNIGGTYFGFYGDTGTELPLEFGVTLRNKDGDSVGDIRLGGYYDTSNVLNYTNQLRSFPITGNISNEAALATLPLQYVRGRSGAYIQLDHMLDGSSKPDAPGTAVFLTGEYSDPNTALLTSYIDAGVVRHGTFASRPDDTIAFGFATANFNPRLQNLELALQGAGYTVPFNDAETAFELNYGIQAAKWIVIRPGLQYVVNPKGEQSNIPGGLIVPKNALVFGLGTYLSF